MKKRILRGIIGGALGFLIGIVSGGYIGLVLGGNLLWKYELYSRIGLEGYELGAYGGAIIGAFSLTILGVYLALRNTDKAE